jgi:hypothetical protein
LVLISTVGLSFFFKKPRAWHGSPSAAVVRATSFIVRLHDKLPQDIVQKLFRLSELCSQDIEYQPLRGRAAIMQTRETLAKGIRRGSGAMGYQQLEGDNKTTDQVPGNKTSKPASPCGNLGHPLTKHTGMVEMVRSDNGVGKVYAYPKSIN